MRLGRRCQGRQLLQEFERLEQQVGRAAAPGLPSVPRSRTWRPPPLLVGDPAPAVELFVWKDGAAEGLGERHRSYAVMRTNSSTMARPDVLDQATVGRLVSAHGSDPSPTRLLGGSCMTCPRCQQDNPSHAKFCLECGVPLGSTSESGPSGAPHAELQRALTEAQEQQTATSEILSLISSSPNDLEPVLDAVATSAARLCSATDALIHLVEGQMMHRVKHVGPIPVNPVAALRRITRDTATGRAILEGRVIHIHDMLEEFARGEYLEARALQTGFRTVLAAPMIVNGVVIGLITVRRTEARPFTAKQIDLVKTFANQSAIAVENVRLFKETKEALEQQTATAEILRVISSSPTDVQPVFDTIVRSAVRLCDGLYGFVSRFDGELIHVAAHHNYTPEGLRALHQMYPIRPGRQLVTGRAILTGAIVHVEDALADPEYAQDFARAGGWRSMLAVPMLRGVSPIGAILVMRAQPGPFPEAQIALLKTFA